MDSKGKPLPGAPGQIPTVPSSPTSPTPVPLPLLSYAVAFVVLIGFGTLVFYMLGIADTPAETLWTRSMLIFSGVEALAFGAAGLVFGTSIQRAHVQSAQAEQKETNEKLINARESAVALHARGQELRAELSALARPAHALEAHEIDNGLQRVAERARELFPD